MKHISIFIFFIPNFLFANILDQFSLACICDKNLNALKYFDCKQKVSGTQLDYNKDINSVFSTYDQKEYSIIDLVDEKLSLIFETDDYSSRIFINEKLELDFSILYKEYNKEWSYDLQCISLKKE